jgi:hypothetical protein
MFATSTKTATFFPTVTPMSGSAGFFPAARVR